MAEQEISSKKRKVTLALVQRVLFICALLIILPLIIYSLILWDKEERLKMRDLFTELRLIGKSYAEITQQWVETQRDLLSLSAELMEHGELVDEELKNIPSEMQQVASTGSKAAIFNGRLYVFFESKQGWLARSVDADEWLKKMQKVEIGVYPFDLSIVTPQGELLLSSDPSLQLSKVRLYSLDQMADLWKNLSVWDEDERPYAVSVHPQGVDFALVVSSGKGALEQLQGPALFSNLWHFLLLLVILGGGATLLLTWRMARPFKQLQAVMGIAEKGDLDVRYQHDALGFEINLLGSRLNATLEALQQQIESTQKERLAKEVLKNELQIGHDIQRSLFPPKLPALPGISVGSGFLPAREVAGDFYDLYFQDNRLVVAIADGSDKGISACLYSLIVRSLLRSQLKQQPDLGKAIAEANNLFCLDTGATGNFVTAWVGIYEPKKRALTFCAAGHPPALLLRKGEILHLTSRESALGVIEMQKPAATMHFVLEKGDLLLLYTDGITDAPNGQGELFGVERLMEFLREAENEAPQEIVESLLREVDQFSQGAVRYDDLTAIALRID